MAKAQTSAYPALAGDSDFPGANGVEFDRIGPDKLRFKMVKHASPACLWWYFRAQVPPGRRVTFELANTTDTLGMPRTWSHVRPVFSYDRVRWQRLPAKDCVFDEGRTVFHFSGSFKQPVVYFAQAYPYHFDELDRLRAELKRSPLFNERIAGTSEEGRPFPLWTLRAKGAQGQPPLGVFISGRHHAGESHGSWAIDGMLREFAFGQSAEARWLREHTALLVAPFVDLDGVWHGMYGKDRTPIDYNRDWSVAPLRREVARLQQEIESWSKTVLYAAHFDFHCPCLPHKHHIHAAVPGLATPRLKAAEKEYAQELERLSPPGSRFNVQDLVFPGYQGPTGEVTCSSYQRLIYGVLSLTPEISYHPLHGGGWIELPALLKYGVAHTRALGRVLKRHEQIARKSQRPFYDPEEAPPVAAAVADEDSPYRWWSNLGGKPERYSLRKLKEARDDEAGQALVIEGDPGQAAFVLTPRIGPGFDARQLSFRAQAEGTRAPRKGERARGLVVHVFYYDRQGRRFGRLNGSAVYELPLEGRKGWVSFTAVDQPPAGTVYARLGIRSELARGRVLLAP